MLDGLSPRNCTVVSFSDLGGDLCEVDDGKLATACSRMPQLPRCFSEDSHAAKTFFFLASSLLMVKKFQPFLVNLVEDPEADCLAMTFTRWMVVS